jgi:hypothetical protein
MEQNIKTVFVIGIIVFVIFSLFLRYKTLPDPAPAKSIGYKETPAEKAYIGQRLGYYGHYADGVIVLKESKREWEFYRNGKYCRL